MSAANGSRQHSTAAALHLVQEQPLWFDSQADSDTTLQLSRAHGPSVYDAVYLELALRRHLPLGRSAGGSAQMPECLKMKCALPDFPATSFLNIAA